MLVTAIKGVVKVGIIESYQSSEFTNAVKNVVEQVFDNHMGELKEELQRINDRFEDLEKSYPP